MALTDAMLSHWMNIYYDLLLSNLSPDPCMNILYYSFSPLTLINSLPLFTEVNFSDKHVLSSLSLDLQGHLRYYVYQDPSWLVIVVGLRWGPVALILLLVQMVASICGGIGGPLIAACHMQVPVKSCPSSYGNSSGRYLKKNVLFSCILCLHVWQMNAVCF